MAERIKTKIGDAKVDYTGNALYFTHEGGIFEQGDIRGTVASTVGGAALIVRIEGGGSYQCHAEDVIAAAIAHHKSKQGA